MKYVTDTPLARILTTLYNDLRSRVADSSPSSGELKTIMIQVPSTIHVGEIDIDVTLDYLYNNISVPVGIFSVIVFNSETGINLLPATSSDIKAGYTVQILDDTGKIVALGSILSTDPNNSENVIMIISPTDGSSGDESSVSHQFPNILVALVTDDSGIVYGARQSQPISLFRFMNPDVEGPSPGFADVTYDNIRENGSFMVPLIKIDLDTNELTVLAIGMITYDATQDDLTDIDVTFFQYGGSQSSEQLTVSTDISIAGIRNIYAGTEDLTAGVSALPTGVIYLRYV